MALRIHGLVKHADNANPALDPGLEDDVAGMLEAVVAGAKVLDAATHTRHFGEARETVLERKKVFVGLPLAEVPIRISVNLGQIPVGGGG